MRSLVHQQIGHLRQYQRSLLHMLGDSFVFLRGRDLATACDVNQVRRGLRLPPLPLTNTSDFVSHEVAPLFPSRPDSHTRSVEDAERSNTDNRISRSENRKAGRYD